MNSEVINNNQVNMNNILIKTNKESLQQIKDDFADPSSEFSMIPFWFWNDKLDEEKIKNQLAEMLIKKIKAACIHPMPDSFRKGDFIAGMPDEYLGERFIECIRFTAEQAQKLGMKIWLYDEGGWPSGLAMGKVAQRNSDFVQKTLHLNVQTGEFLVIQSGNRTDILNPETTKAFIDITYEKYKAAVGDFFGNTITGIFTDEPNIAGHIGSFDIPWTKELPEFFKKIKGYDIMGHVRCLFKDAEKFEDITLIKKIRYDFCDIVSLLFTESYFKPINDWCSINNIKLVGHLDRDHAISEHLSGGYSLPRLLQYYDIPGVDCIWRQIYPDKSQIDFPKFASSVAHTRNKKFVLSESFGAYGLGLTFSQMKNLVDLQYVRGINVLVPHAFHYSCQGPRAFGVNSNLFLSDPRWSYFKEFSQYVSRLSFLMSCGESSADVGLYYPIAGLWSEGLESHFAKEIVADFEDISDCLMQNQIECDYLDDDAILSDKAEIKNGVCAVGEGKYKCIIFPKGSVYRSELLNFIDKFVYACGTVLFGKDSFSETLLDTANGSGFLESVKCLLKSGKDIAEKKWGKGRLVFSENTKKALNSNIVERAINIARPNKNVKVCRRVSKNFNIYFLVNESNQKQKLLVNFKCSGLPSLADVEKGIFQEIKPTAANLYEILLLEYGSRVVIFDKTQEKADLAYFEKNDSTSQRLMVYPGLWDRVVIRQYSFRDGELYPMPLNYELSEKKGPTPWESDFNDTFSGTIEYSGIINMPDKREDKKIIVNLGSKIEDRMFRVWVNEKYVGSKLWSPFEFDISSFVNTGENRIRVSVSNTLGNIMKSESVIKDLKDLGWFNIYMKKISRMCNN